jgi:hypothetical protein
MVLMEMLANGRKGGSASWITGFAGTHLGSGFVINLETIVI